MPGFEVRACDEDGREVPRGEVGRLWVRGGSRAIAYWQNLPQTLETFRGEWVALADLVSIDDDGYVTYCGRADDVLKVGGKWCTPGEIEACLLQHPAVRECAVVGAEDAAGLTKPVAFVVAGDEQPPALGRGAQGLRPGAARRLQAPAPRDRRRRRCRAPTSARSTAASCARWRAAERSIKLRALARS